MEMIIVILQRIVFTRVSSSIIIEISPLQWRNTPNTTLQQIQRPAKVLRIQKTRAVVGIYFHLKGK